MRPRPFVLPVLFALFCIGIVAPSLATAQTAQPVQPIVPPSSTGLAQLEPSIRAVGSWWGRAIPSKTVCTKAQDPTCPVPSEIIMVFTIHEDHTFIGIDSNIFSGGSHSTAHGTWATFPTDQIKARFTLLQSAPNGVFIGGFTNLFAATLTDDDNMVGTIDAYLYLYTNPDGSSVIGADGLPTPSPLDAPKCAAPTCQALGIFSFKAKRVKLQ